MGQQLNELGKTVNQHTSILYRNEKALADMVYTNSVRIAVLRRLVREKLGVDDTAFEALVDQELAKRKEEEEESRKAAEEKIRNQTATERAKELGIRVAKDHVASMEDIEFGGDFGESDETVDEEASHPDTPGDEPNGGGAELTGGPVEEIGHAT